MSLVFSGLENELYDMATKVADVPNVKGFARRMGKVLNGKRMDKMLNLIAEARASIKDMDAAIIDREQASKKVRDAVSKYEKDTGEYYSSNCA